MQGGDCKYKSEILKFLLQEYEMKEIVKVVRGTWKTRVLLIITDYKLLLFGVEFLTQVEGKFRGFCSRSDLSLFLSR